MYLLNNLSGKTICGEFSFQRTVNSLKQKKAQRIPLHLFNQKPNLTCKNRLRLPVFDQLYFKKNKTWDTNFINRARSETVAKA
jgi:hypothetical protein